MTPEANDQQRQHPRIFLSAYLAIQIITCKHGILFYMVSCFIVRQYSTPIHPSFFVLLTKTSSASLYSDCISANELSVCSNVRSL